MVASLSAGEAALQPLREANVVPPLIQLLESGAHSTQPYIRQAISSVQMLPPCSRHIPYCTDCWCLLMHCITGPVSRAG